MTFFSLRPAVKYAAGALVLAAAAFSSLSQAADERPRVAMTTDLGTYVIELYPAEAPATVANFLAYVDSKFYDGTIYHRVIPGFVVQGGGLNFDFTQRETRDPIVNESDNGLRNDYKTLAMARTNDPHSASSQFYINLRNNDSLNAAPNKPGYTVFGKVVEGMEVVEKIVEEPRGMHRAFPEAPNYAVRTLSAKRVDADFKPDNKTGAVKIPMQNSKVRDALVKP